MDDNSSSLLALGFDAKVTMSSWLMYMPRGGFLLCFSLPPLRGLLPRYDGPLVGRRLPVRLNQDTKKKETRDKVDETEENKKIRLENKFQLFPSFSFQYLQCWKQLLHKRPFGVPFTSLQRTPQPSQ